ncbi:MAG: DUF2203 family protein [Trueperaceae bacterium]|nr:DUF2203 family protein [Trueperaceae bacterium]
MYKLFSLERAQQMIPVVDAHIAALQRTMSDMNDAKRRLAKTGAHDPEALNARQEAAFLTQEARETAEALARLGVQVEDLEAGVALFPSRIDGEVVNLVWERGEDAITHYARLTGDDTLRPLGPSGP